MTERVSSHGLGEQGIATSANLYWNLTTAPLVELAIERQEGLLAKDGPLVVTTGKHTGRSAQDKFIVRDAETEDTVWWGKSNKGMTPDAFANLKADFLAQLATKPDLFIQDLHGGSQPEHRVKVRIINEYSWHSLFIRTMLVRPAASELVDFVPDYTIICLPSFRADPERHGCRSETVIAVNFTEKLILIGGTEYGGEMKKSVFGLLNYLLPPQGIMPMHCSANIGPNGDTAIFFGLSGTGKTTLSADQSRTLIGDDEHGWSDTAVFNFEGGCYAKMIRLSAESEPEIFAVTKRFGTVLENVVMDETTRELDLDDATLAENSRGVYPIDYIPNTSEKNMGPVPKNLIMLTADAFGVLPPIARLTPEQAMYHFLSGYTAKVAGTEAGVTGPQVAFSTCFAAPFLPLSPGRYAEMLREKLTKHGSQVWLVNTGWTGGPPGVGNRFKLVHTRAMVRAILGNALTHVSFVPDPVFGVSVPNACPGVPEEVLRPRDAWNDPSAYDAQARHLAGLFRENFKKYADQMTEAVRQAEPRG